MSASFLAAAIQMQSGADKETNLEIATRLILQAAEVGAQLAVLPELFNCLASYAIVASQAESVPGPTSERLARIAAERKLLLAAGSIAERDAASGNVFNTSLLFGPDGAVLARYRKLHLFDVDLPGQVSVQESRWFAAGSDVAPVPTALGTLGTAICYDLRFPELFRRLTAAKTQIILLPSAFTAVTGRDHWEILLRARAIENQCYVIAANQSGTHGPDLTTYGHSAIIDPWGRVLAMAQPEPHEQIILAELDLAKLSEIRARLPALTHLR